MPDCWWSDGEVLWQPYRAMPKSPMGAKQGAGRALEVGESYEQGKDPTRWCTQPEHRWHYSWPSITWGFAGGFARE